MRITKSYLSILRVGMTLFCLALLAAPPGAQAAPRVAGVRISLQTVTGGTTLTGVVTLVETVGGTGVPVQITSDNPAVRVGPNVSQVSSSSSVTVPVGANSSTFQIVTLAVGSNTPATIRASLPNSTGAATMTVIPPTLKSVSVSVPTFSASQFPGGVGASILIFLTGPAPPEFILEFDIPPATLVTILPSNMITVRAGSTGHSQPLNTKPVDRDTPIKGHITGGGATLPVNFVLVPPGAESLICGATTVVGGAIVPGCQARLNAFAAAPTGGIKESSPTHRSE